MKLKYIIVCLTLISCARYYKIEDLSIEKSQKAYIFGTYSFTTNFVYLPSRIGISINKGSKISTYFIFNQNEGMFLIPIDEGKYKFTSIDLYSKYTYETYDSQKANFTLNIKGNTVYYIGKFIPVLSFDVEYIYWGISQVSDDFDKDILLLKKIKELENFEITNITLHNIEKIKKLKYSPASPSNF